MTYPDLHQALQILGLGERATLREIKNRHKALVKIHHPDTGNADDPDVIRMVNASYRLLLDYVSAYHFCFSEDEFYEQCPEERLRRQFMDDL